MGLWAVVGGVRVREVVISRKCADMFGVEYEKYDEEYVLVLIPNEMDNYVHNAWISDSEPHDYTKWECAVLQALGVSEGQVALWGLMA